MTRRPIKNFRDLEVWRRGKSITLIVYKLTKKFPPEELYGLVSQLRRAAVSVPANIAEGFNRNHTKEFMQFLYIALSSCAELETHLEISYDLGYCTLPDRDGILNEIEIESKMLRALIKKLT